MKGHFITFEGGEGSGKTTQLAILGRYLESRGYPVVRTREPGGTKIGDGIRSLLVDSKNLEMSAKTELFLYLASRAQHLKEVILPALESGKIVLCDRFTDSTVVYQGYGRKLPLKELEQVTKFASQDLQPQLTFLLDIDVKRGLSRLRGSPNNDFHSTSSGHNISYQLRVEVNRFDEEALQFHEVIRQEFLNRAKEYPDRFRVIDADASVEEISKKIREVMDAFLS